ncbi:type I-E CRISPR-associated protein Cas5/CasD [Corynebacterium anserum]|uniref:Type I-E CRISPR-associated protein Cas5/CasD n=1 Tax=Corynebacterium anserum TaxID=2684406 RepID=A0A7G7YLR9_9CORY|nr:type I-E CRISPR-associated protein Cas5/CasD [Corynebacterium anserum]MBC2681397.1 type I-E CRISPR-associated protein Cas5/CasD [Corynebacterium anserum]QNH95439.1 type I-E CRISPR-associated protein Cas5/CasD [Corynebacterium anserum]
MSYSLLLLLKGPMQSWGDESRYGTRATGNTPSKSGVIGLLAAAQGRQRTDPIEDLVRLDFAVRVDQSGSLMRDYQTAQPWQRNLKANASLVTRHYLSDAAFVAAIGSDDRALLEALQEQLRKPAYPLFLGRRSCPAPANLDLGIVNAPVVEALLSHDRWHATLAHKKERSTRVELPIYRDGRPGETGTPRQDVPLSFAQEHRKYGWRTVVYAGSKEMLNDHGTSRDPFFEAVISS